MKAMNRPTYAELKAENAQLRRRVASLEDLVRGLTQQVAEILKGSSRSPPSSKGAEDRPKKFGAQAEVKAFRRQTSAATRWMRASRAGREVGSRVFREYSGMQKICAPSENLFSLFS
jgi:hypothetical protein